MKAGRAFRGGPALSATHEDALMVKLQALKSFRYADRRLEPGDEFGATERDARLLAAIGRVVVVEGMQADGANPGRPHPQPRRGKYRRRDLRAE